MRGALEIKAASRRAGADDASAGKSLGFNWAILAQLRLG